MNYNNSIPKKTAGIIKVSCGLLFMLFSFCYLFFVQGDVLAEAQHSYSNGLTTYSLPVGAVIITLVLQIVQWILTKVIRFEDKWYALSYFPSFLGLTLLTDVNESVIEHFTLGDWSWILPVVLLVYVLIVLVAKRIHGLMEDELSSDTFSGLWPNFLIILICIVLTGSIPNSTDVYHYELKTERLLKDKKWSEAALVGIRSQHTSERLTQLRMYALARMDSLGDRIFAYPHPYGTDGLIDIADTDTVSRVATRNICTFLGSHPGSSIKTSAQYLQLIADRADSVANPRARQYYLCHLLLKGDLATFADRITAYYGDTIVTPLPRAYQEALLVGNTEYLNDSVVSTLSADSIVPYMTLETIVRYHDYEKLKHNADSTRALFGDTYWWYYDNRKTKKQK